MQNVILTHTHTHTLNHMIDTVSSAAAKKKRATVGRPKHLSFPAPGSNLLPIKQRPGPPFVQPRRSPPAEPAHAAHHLDESMYSKNITKRPFHHHRRRPLVYLYLSTQVTSKKAYTAAVGILTRFRPGARVDMIQSGQCRSPRRYVYRTVFNSWTIKQYNLYHK